MWLARLGCIGKRFVCGIGSGTHFSFRLRGHRDQITAIRFLSVADDQLPTSPTVVTGFLLSASKDTFMKLWDLSTQHGIQTIVAHRSEVWSLDIDSQRELVFTGSGEGELKAWKIDFNSLSEGLREMETGGVITSQSYIKPVLFAFPGFENDTPNV